MVSRLPIPKGYLIAAIILAIIGVIGILMQIYASSPPWLLSLGETIGVFGLLGTWITVLTGATANLQKETIELQRRTIELQKETIELLTEIRKELSEGHKKILTAIKVS